MEFGKKLKELRTKKGVSQEQLAESIYVSRSAVAKWENGLGFPSSESMRLLAEYFEVSAEELCSDKTSESVIVNKNVVISKSRKILIAVTSVSIAVIIALIVCVAVYVYRYNNAKKDDWAGGSKAKVVGVDARVYDKNQVAVDRWEDHRYYVCDTLNVGEQYTFKVTPILTGGSTPMVFTADSITLDYDKDIFDISIVNADMYNPDYFITIKKPCSYVGVEISVKSGFRTCLVFSATDKNADVDN